MPMVHTEGASPLMLMKRRSLLSLEHREEPDSVQFQLRCGLHVSDQPLRYPRRCAHACGRQGAMSRQHTAMRKYPYLQAHARPNACHDLGCMVPKDCLQGVADSWYLCKAERRHAPQTQ